MLYFSNEKSSYVSSRHGSSNKSPRPILFALDIAYGFPKPNAGKSSILNNILGENRVIVSPIAGTTRDAIDTYFEKDGQQYLLIDTAGIRRKSKVYERVEKFSVIRSMSAVERADVVLIVIDATEGVTEQDTKVAGIAHDEGKGCIFIVNKWDLIEKDNKTLGNYTKEIREKFPFMMY